MSARRPAALSRGPAAKPRSKQDARFASRPATRNSAAMPGCIRPSRMRFKPCATRMRLLRSSRTTSATVPRATRSSSVGEIGFRPLLEPAAPAQLRPQREHDVEHHAHAGDGLAGEVAARLVRIDDARGLRQRIAGQMVVGDQRGDAELVGARHAFDAGDAVVDGDQQVGAPRRARGEIDDFGREAIAVFEAVGHEIGHVRAECGKRAHADGAGGGAIAIVVGDDQQALFRFDGIGEQRRGALRMQQPLAAESAR